MGDNELQARISYGRKAKLVFACIPFILIFVLINLLGGFRGTLMELEV